jgi:hypothetical protein
MAIDNDASDLTLQTCLLPQVAINLVGDVPHFEAYQEGIEEATGVADVAALQAIIDAVNLELALLKIMAFADANDASAMSVEDLAAAGVNTDVGCSLPIDFYIPKLSQKLPEQMWILLQKLKPLLWLPTTDVKQSAIAAIIEMSTAGNADDPYCDCYLPRQV